jgi:hypothetical protein
MPNVLANRAAVENRRDYPGLHLTADAEGRKVLVDHLSQLESGCVREARIHLAPVTEVALRVPSNRGGTARHAEVENKTGLNAKHVKG